MRSVKTRFSTLDLANALAGALCVLLLTAFLITTVWAATGSPGTIGPSGPTITYMGTALGTGAQGETGAGGCVDGTNCDTYTLNVTGSSTDYAGKLISVAIDSDVPANDYDLYIHKGDVNGTLVASSANSAPPSHEEATINPAKTGTGVYTIHVVYFAAVVTPAAIPPAPSGQYTGTIKVLSQNVAAGRTATYTYGGLTFAADRPLKAPVSVSDGEPSSRTDMYGNYYASGIRGFPAGVDLWYFDLRPTVMDLTGNSVSNPAYDPLMRYPLYRGQPDAFVGYNANLQQSGVNGGGDGGGDIDLAVGFGPGSDTLGNSTPPTLAYASLIAANLSTGKSQDTGKTFQQNVAGNVPGGVAGDDRQWLEFFGSKTVYMLYRTLDPAVTQIQASLDGGLTYGPATTAGLIGQSGAIDVDPADGTVYVSGSTGTVGVGKPEVAGTPPVRYSTVIAATDPNGVAHLFFQVAVAHDAGANGKPYGTVYCLYSNDSDVFLEYSLDQAKTWSAPVKVNGPNLGTHINIFPRMALGTTPGAVGIVWYATTDSTISGAFVGSQQAMWKVYYAQTYNATAPSPTFRNTVVSNHFIHAGNVSEGGLVVNGPSPNRNLLDYFEISFDPMGAAVISYTDDHNDFNGNCFATRQTGGPSINGGTVASAVEGTQASAVQDNFTSPPPVPGPDGSQVTDFAQDQSSGLVVTTPIKSPADILSIKYYSVSTPGGKDLVATMRVSDLNNNGAGVPPGSYWRMCFAANAPNAVVDPTGTYSGGLSDLGDQFYLRADKTTTGLITYTYGTIVRNVDGSLTYSASLGNASGSLDTANNTVTVRVPLSAFNALLSGAGRPQIVRGSVLCGLRGTATTAGSGDVVRDDTYGGTQYKIP